VDISRFRHRIAGLGIDPAVVVALVLVVVEVVLGESNAVGKGLAVVRQGALLHHRRSVARQRGGIQGLAPVAGQQSHVLLRVVHLGGRLAVVGHVVDVAELGEGVGGLVHGTGHLQLLHGPAGGAGSTTSTTTTTTTPTPQLRRGWCF